MEVHTDIHHSVEDVTTQSPVANLGGMRMSLNDELVTPPVPVHVSHTDDCPSDSSHPGIAGAGLSDVSLAVAGDIGASQLVDVDPVDSVSDPGVSPTLISGMPQAVSLSQPPLSSVF